MNGFIEWDRFHVATKLHLWIYWHKYNIHVTCMYVSMYFCSSYRSMCITLSMNSAQFMSQILDDVPMQRFSFFPFFLRQNNSQKYMSQILSCLSQSSPLILRSISCYRYQRDSLAIFHSLTYYELLWIPGCSAFSVTPHPEFDRTFIFHVESNCGILFFSANDLHKT